MKKLIVIALILLMHQAVMAGDTFYWTWRLVKGQIKVSGNLNDEMGTSVVVSSAETMKRFALVYDIIDNIKYNKLSLYLKTIDTLSNQLVRPFITAITKSASIVIEMDPSLLYFPVEFLQMGSTSISLIRPLVFKMDRSFSAQTEDTLTLHRGFIIRDPTADPENACINTFHKYPASKFKSAYNILQKDLIARPGIDFILISAHGYVDSVTLKGGIGLNKIETVSPAFFKLNNPKIIYIDGCQQGINLAYISALAQTREPNYYIGPIISNDSGESSTKTINWFFANLKQTHQPIISLWKTRKQLYQHYEKRIKTMDVINKSMIFRIYKI